MALASASSSNCRKAPFSEGRIEMSFKGKVAAVVGGASGVGAEVANIIASQGGEVVILDIQEGLAAKVAEDIRGLGGTASVVRVDVTSPDSVKAAAEDVLARHDRVDVLA